jgi:pyruvate dehydrogenase E2 component (dihydrolipoamide acetyltransferase)
MPKMSMTMEEGTMVAWLKNVGDLVKSGEAICEVATDKVDMEVESPFDGVLASILAHPDEVIKVGEPIGMITTEADDLLGGLFDGPAPAVGAEVVAPAVAVETIAVDTTLSTGTGWIASVPNARELAAELGVNLGAVAPTGPWGSVRVADVEAHAGTSAPVSVPVSAPAPVAAIVPAVPAAPAVDAAEARRRRTRLQVAKVMSASAAVPQFTAFVDLDLSVLAPIRKTTLGGASWTAILVRAQAIALREFPQLNGFWSDTGVELNRDIRIALAVDSPGGLLAPVLHNPDLLSLPELMIEIARVIDAARSGTLGMDGLSGGTSVFSNLGGFGVESFNALITPPMATALSAGAVREKITVTGPGAFGARLMCTVGLTVDHRVADGGDAARLLSSLKAIVTDPGRIA